MKRIVLTTLVCGGLLAGTALAQERAAGQAYDAQVNWAALSTQLNALKTQNQALAASITTMQTSLTNLTTTVNALSSKVLVMDSKLTAIATCGAQQKYWNGSACVTAGADSLPTIQTGVFSESCGYSSCASPASDAYCQGKGYDAVTEVTTQTSTKHTGGSSGGDTTYTSGYTIRCMRVVSR
jgi:hypothetical protein